MHALNVSKFTPQIFAAKNNSASVDGSYGGEGNTVRHQVGDSTVMTVAVAKIGRNKAGIEHVRVNGGIGGNRSQAEGLW